MMYIIRHLKEILITLAEQLKKLAAAESRSVLCGAEISYKEYLYGAYLRHALV